MNTSLRYGGGLLLTVAALASCSGGGDDSLRRGLESLSQDTSGAAATSGADAAPGSSASVSAPYPTPIPMDTAGWAPERRALSAGGWTAQRVEAQRTGALMTTLSAVRFARHDEYDRFVLVFGGAGLPGYSVEYLQQPGRECGSGEKVKIDGDARLRIRLSPAQAHDDRGNATLRERAFEPNLENVEELKLTCDFEGEVEWLVGVRSAKEYRVLELSDPARLVIDVRND